MIAVIDYGGGNLFSVARALRYIGEDPAITRDAATILKADKIIIPGVGRAGAVMENLRRAGLIDVLRICREEDRFMLGICIGIQVICDRSEEDDVDGLGLLPGEVHRFSDRGDSGALKVPQIGWNEVQQTRRHPLFNGIPNPSHFYFVNSYYPVPRDPSVTIGATCYGVNFASAVASGHLVATQFHLEKSGPLGLKMLENFCRWKG